nr:p13 [Darna trima granulovirus]
MKCAYVTLVMLGNYYVKGAIALAKSLHRSGTDHDLICMVTEDVTYKKKLKKLYTRVITVPYIYFSCGKMLTERQRKLYNHWINFSFTKWRCFELILYDRCIYLDADHIVLRNIDHLFKYNHAMCFNYNYNAEFINFNQGHVITPEVHKFIIDNYKLLAFTGTMVFTPNTYFFNVIMSLLNKNNKLLNDSKNIFNNGYDEIVLAQALIETNTKVVQLSPMYVWNAGDYDTLKRSTSQPYVINYYGDIKPWSRRAADQYMDVYIWKYFYRTKNLTK